MKEPAFLTLDEVLALHADPIDRYGGSAGLRDLGLLESAIAAPRATFGGGLLGVAEGRIGKAEVAVFVQKHVVDAHEAR